MTRDEGLMEEVLKCTFCRVQLLRQGSAPPHHAAVCVASIAQTYQETLAAICRQFPDVFVEEQILLDPEHVLYIDRALAPLNLLDPTRDIIGDIYEAFMGSGYRGQEGQFFTPKNAVRALVDLVQPTADDTIIDPACGAAGFLLEAGRRLTLDPARLPLHVFGVDKDRYLARLGRLHLAIQFSQPFRIECADSLAWGGNGFDASPVKAKLGSFSLILTNPPFGAKIVSLAGQARTTFDLARKWTYSRERHKYIRTGEFTANTPPQVLFIERCLSLLADGGRMGIVLPESVLSNVSHRYVVQYLLERATPLAVLGMPESLFKTSGKGGTHTKVCLVVLRKGATLPNHHIFMAEAKWCGHDSRGQTVPNDDLPAIVEKYLRFQRGETIRPDHNGYVVPLDALRDSVLAPRFYNPEPVHAMAQLADTHHLYNIGDLVRQGAIAITTGDEMGKLSYGSGDVPFVRTSDLSNWEIKVDPKHCVSEEAYRRLAKKQDVREGDILMVRDGTYLIGTCALVSRYDTRIVFQSHIYKIRVTPAAPFDHYLLLAALSSPPVVSQIRAMSFTQDIIDSLGDRIKDLVIPIPKDESMRHRISSMVKKVVDDRIEARELARLARLEIVGTLGYDSTFQPTAS